MTSVAKNARHIARTIEESRCGQGLSQRELALRARMDVSSISRYESGERVPHKTTARRLEEALGLELGTLMNGAKGSGAPPTTAFARLLLDSRMAAGLSQTEVAATIGCLQAAYSRWERGDDYPHMPRFVRVIDALGINPLRALNAIRTDNHESS